MYSSMCMYVFFNTYMYVCVCVRMYACRNIDSIPKAIGDMSSANLVMGFATCMYVYVYMCMYSLMCVYVFFDTCMYACMCVCMYACRNIDSIPKAIGDMSSANLVMGLATCMYVYIYIYVCLCMHVHVYVHPCTKRTLCVS